MTVSSWHIGSIWATARCRDGRPCSCAGQDGSRSCTGRRLTSLLWTAIKTGQIPISPLWAAIDTGQGPICTSRNKIFTCHESGRDTSLSRPLSSSVALCRFLSSSIVLPVVTMIRVGWPRVIFFITDISYEQVQFTFYELGSQSWRRSRQTRAFERSSPFV